MSHHPTILLNASNLRIQFQRRIITIVGMFLILLAALALAACSQTEPTFTPIPTATPIPTPPATQGPLAVRRDVSLPAPDPNRLAQVSELLSLVPATYHSVIALDIKGLKESPVLSGLVDPDRLGIPGIIPIDASALLERVAVAVATEGQITLMQGDIDVASMLNLVGGFGLSLNIPDPEDYRGHQVWDIEILGITLTLGQADTTTVIFSSGSSAEGPTAAANIKESLDAFDGLAPGFLSGPNAQRLLGGLPSGFAAAILADCGGLGQLATIIDVPGCAGAAISAEITGAGEVTIYGLAAFEDEGQASAALEIALNRVQEEEALPFDEVAVGQEQELVWTIIVVREEQVAEALGAFQFGSR